MSVDVLFVSHYWQKKTEEEALTNFQKMTSLSIKIQFFLSGSPLRYEITQQRDNEWDPCCTLYYICYTLHIYHLLNSFTLYNFT